MSFNVSISPGLPTPPVRFVSDDTCCNSTAIKVIVFVSSLFLAIASFAIGSPLVGLGTLSGGVYFCVAEKPFQVLPFFNAFVEDVPIGGMRGRVPHRAVGAHSSPYSPPAARRTAANPYGVGGMAHRGRVPVGVAASGAGSPYDRDENNRFGAMAHHNRVPVGGHT